VALAIADQRGVSSEHVADDDDVIDPYRRSRDVYEQSGAEMTPAIVEVERIVRAALA
jgi:protein-tyrosine phosphatase